MTGESQAARRARLFDHDWDQIHADLAHRHAEAGNTSGVATLEAALASYLATPGRPGVVNPVAGFLEAATDDVIAGMIDTGFDARRLSTAHLLLSSRNDVCAETRPFDDGSSLVVVSDSLLTLCAFYCRCAGLVLSGEDGLDAATIAGMLRYYHVQQRVHGLAGMLAFEVPGRAAELTSALVTQAARFVAGHELVHHALGHGSELSGFHPGEHLSVCSGDQLREYQADAGAHTALLRTCEKEAGDAQALALWGALAAVLAVYSSEKALFVRNGGTHPPALDRIRMLLAQVGESVRGRARMLLGPLLEATDAATVFAVRAELFDGDQVLASPFVSTPLTRGYLGQISVFDALMSHPHQKLVEGVERLDPATPRLAGGTRLAAAGRAAEAFESWGVDPEVGQRLLNPAIPLTFHSLRMAMKKAFTDLGVQKDSVLAASVVAATLLEPSLRTP